MAFNSIQFIIFFPITVLIYYVIPHRVRNIWLLITSYFFYMCWNPVHVFILGGVTAVTYFCGRLLEKNNKKVGSKKRADIILALCCVVNLAVLSVFKYSGFAISNINHVFELLHLNTPLKTPDILLPIGISFYTFQAIGYIIDVYRGEVQAEKNIIRYATFVAFFPQLVAGPIERFSNLSKQFTREHRLDYEKVKSNLLLMLWGFFLKIVIADRIAIYVDWAYGNHEILDGWYLIVASVLFAIQIYCDFNGYTLIARGAAGVMGFELMNNFDSPYCSTGIKQFWSGWHISLTSWFRDYLYIPLGGNRKGKVRKYINQMIVFLLSGLWHGATWSYVAWGGLNGAYLVIEDALQPVNTKICRRLNIKKEMLWGRIIRAVITFVLVDISWILFRSGGIGTAYTIFRKIFSAKDASILFGKKIYEGVFDGPGFYIIWITILILLFVDVCHKKGFHFREWLQKKRIWFRWIVYFALVFSILIFGIWGSSYDASNFIYFQF